jgi:putative membrane protein
MFIEILVAILAGVFCGIFTGLIPGIHVNLIALGILSALPFLLSVLSPLQLIVLIVSMGITHTFLDVVPAVFLGAPSSDTALMVLPAHRLLAKGQGLLAVRLATLGGLLSLLSLTVLSPAIYWLVRLAYPFLRQNMGFLLSLYILFFLLRPKSLKTRFFTLLVFALSGTLGLIVLNHGDFRQPLFPMLTGFFGISLLIDSLLSKPFIRAQGQPKQVKLSLKGAVAGACFGGLITGVFPGIGAAQAAMIGKTFFRKLNPFSFIVLNGGVNTVNFFVSFFTLHIAGRARNGAVLAVKSIGGSLQFPHLVLIVIVSLLSAGVAALLTISLAKAVSNLFQAINYRKLSLWVLAGLGVLCFCFSGLLGLAVLGISASIGLLPSRLGISKSACMGCILLPVTIYLI